MKIGLICDKFLPSQGGIELHVSRLSQELARRGHQVHILTPYPGESDSPLVKVHRINADFIPRTQTLRNLKSLEPLETILKEEKFDLLHCHNSIVWPFAYAGIFLAKKLRIPAVFTAHSLYSLGSQSVGTLLRPWIRFDRLPCIFTGVSKESVQRLKRVFRIKDAHLLPNGIQTKDWELTKKESPFPLIITMMRLGQKKRPMDLIWALNKISKEFPDELKPQLIFFGEGNLKNRLVRKVQSLKLENQVRFLGWQSAEVIKKEMAKSWVHIQPSPWESFSIATLEACSAGVPSIIRSQSGARDIISPGVEGMAVGSKQELARALLKILQDSSLRHAMGEKAKLKAQQFNWERVIDRHLEIYTMAMKKMGIKKPRILAEVS